MREVAQAIGMNDGEVIATLCNQTAKESSLP